MTCFHPLRAYRSAEVNPSTGKRQITFNPHKNHVEGSHFCVPCGRCIGCRLDRAKDYETRCMHEAKMWPSNCFLTLTFDDQNLPDDYSVHVRTLQLFNKRLRKSLPQKIRFFACGEYGDLTLRPHYHSLIFNHDFTDKQFYKNSPTSEPLFTSLSLQKIWPYGQALIGTVTNQSAGYVARYNLKKITGDLAPEHYTRIHPLSGNLVRVQAEFLIQSSKPGIGRGWFEQFKSDVHPSDFVVVKGRKRSVPKYYTKQLTEKEQQRVKRARIRERRRHRADQTKDRLLVRETVKLSQLKMLKRPL